MARIGTSAESARESARNPDGTFGTQPAAESGATLGLVGDTSPPASIDDTQAWDRIALTLGSAQQWEGVGDYLDDVASAVAATGRPHPGDADPHTYRTELIALRDGPDGHQGADGDSNVLDRLALGLAQTPDWDADTLEVVADLTAATGRPHPGAGIAGQDYRSALGLYRAERDAVADALRRSGRTWRERDSSAEVLAATRRAILEGESEQQAGEVVGAALREHTAQQGPGGDLDGAARSLLQDVGAAHCARRLSAEPDASVKGVGRANQCAYRLSAPVSAVEPAWSAAEGDPRAVRQFDRVVVSYSGVEDQVLVLGVDSRTDRADFSNVVFDSDVHGRFDPDPEGVLAQLDQPRFRVAP